MTDAERTVEVIKRSVQLEIYGIKLEDIKQTTGKFGIPENIKIYFSVPESSTMYDESEDETFNEKLKTSEGLTQIGKEIIVDMIMCGDGGEDISTEDISDFVKFYVKVRNGETWTKEQGDETLKVTNEQIKTAVEKLKSQNGYKEV